MDLAERIDTLAAEWRRHCERVSYSSNPGDYLNHPAFEQLVALGDAAVPLLMRRYTATDVPWEAVLERITGVNLQDDPSVFDAAAVRQRRLDWWARNCSRYAADARAQS
jgi:hypothetical protein